MRISKKIVKEQADRFGITQRELALKLKISSRQVNRWFTSDSPIPSKYHKKMKDILHLTDDEGAGLTQQEKITTRTRKTPNFMKKRISVTVSPQTTNAYEFIEHRFGISRHKLVEIAPLLLNCLSTLAIEHDAKQLEKYDGLDLPKGWGPAKPEAEELVKQQQQTVKEQDAFSSKSLTRFINHLISTRMNCGTITSDEISNSMWSKLIGEEVDVTPYFTHFDLNEKTPKNCTDFAAVDEDGKKPVVGATPFPQDFKEFFSFNIKGQTDARFVSMITAGLLDLSQIQSDLWSENQRPELYKAIIDLANKTLGEIKNQDIDYEQKNELISNFEDRLSGLLSLPVVESNVIYNTANAKFEALEITPKIFRSDERKGKDDR